MNENISLLEEDDYLKLFRLQEYLIKSGEELAWARDTDTALDRISNIITSELANWFSIDIIDGDVVSVLKVHHQDPELVKWGERFKQQNPVDLSVNYGLAAVLKTGKPDLAPVITYELLAQRISDPEKLQVLKMMNLQSVMIVAMRLKEKIMGAITFISTKEGVHYDEIDLRVAQDLANRIAITLENVRLNEAAEKEIKSRKKAERSLIESEKKFQIIADFIPVKIFTTDANGSITYYNKEWERFLGLSTNDLYNSTLLPYIHPDDVDKNVETWIDAINKVEPFKYEHRFLYHDGSYRWQLTRATPTVDENGKVTAWIGSTTDIDEQKREEQKKDEFLNIASHELRTPITSIKGYYQIVKLSISKNKYDQLEKYVDKAGKQVDKLTELVNNFLDVSKIQAGKLLPHKTTFNIDDIIQESKEFIDVHYSPHKVHITGDMEIQITGDKNRLEQVITNLLTNAAKYSAGQDKIILKSEVADQHLKISVQDFGEGIPESKLPFIFDRFYRVNENHNDISGLGLGLYICSEIIKAHNGKVGVDSQVGFGSTFWFTIPIE
jgi:PAS domain S-box-containing protein